MKILKNVKALSPVVASIILIAVTVAVSLAVAIWMMGLATIPEQISWVDHQWDTSGDVEWFVFTIKNTGSSDISIQDIRIDGVSAATIKYKTPSTSPPTGSWNTFSAPLTVPKGYYVSFNVTRTGNFAHGASYDFTIVTAKTTFGPFTKQAP